MFVLFDIAEVGAVRSVVPAAQLPDAFATEQARYSTVYLAGPPLGGGLFGIGRALPFLVDAVSYAFSLGTLLAMRTPFQEEREASATTLRDEVREGLSWLWQQKFLRTCALLFAASNLSFGALELTESFSARMTVGGLAAWLLGLAVLTTASRSIRAAPSFQDAVGAAPS
jgi:hypothetical protein